MRRRALRKRSPGRIVPDEFSPAHPRSRQPRRLWPCADVQTRPAGPLRPRYRSFRAKFQISKSCTSRTAPVATARRERMELQSLSAIPCTWRLQTTRSSAARRQMEFPGRRCLLLRKAPAACSPISRLTRSSAEFANAGRSPDVLRGANPPPYSSSGPGDSSRGSEVYASYCSSCHGPDGRGGQKASSIVDGSFLALLDDQELRTIVIVGRPELGAPDWRDNVPGKPMSAQDVSDVVAWLASQRPKFPGQPYPNIAKSTGEVR